MKRYLGMTQEEITENEKLWKEENAATLKASLDAAAEMRAAGVSPAATGGEIAAQSAEAPPDMAAEAEAGAAEAPPAV
jgi:hypothetical protein